MKLPRLNRYRTGGTSTNLKLSLPAPRTPDGRVYRLSPNENAQPRHFVLGNVVAEIPLTETLRARMKHEPRLKQTVCPYSGQIGDDDAFIHPEDVKAAVEIIKHEAAHDIQDAFAEMLQNAFKGQSQGGGLLKITAKVERSPQRPMPRFGRRDLMRELVCDHCGRDYGVFAIGLFCPDCGAPNLRLHFAREAELVDDQVSLAESIGSEQEELAYRLLGNAHEDVLTAFEATLKTVYLYGHTQLGTSPVPRVGNDFQNVDKALKRFTDLNCNPFEALTEPEVAALRLNIQKRHIIGHNLGIVDDKFAIYANDAKVGETVELIGGDIREFAAISQKVVDKLDTWLCGSPSPTIQSTVQFAMKEVKINSDDPKNLMALHLQLSLLARKMGLWISEKCPDGLRNFVQIDALRSDFKDFDESELEEAVAELATDGFIEVSRSLGGGIPHFRPTLDLYLTFDASAFGWDTIGDTITVAELALSGADGVNAETLLAQTGWTLRRFNPVLAHVASEIPEGRVSRQYGRFSVAFFHLLPEDRVRMKRLISRLKS